MRYNTNTSSLIYLEVYRLENNCSNTEIFTVDQLTVLLYVGELLETDIAAFTHLYDYVHAQSIQRVPEPFSVHQESTS